MPEIIAIFLITAWILPLHARVLQCDPLKPAKETLSPRLQALLKAGRCRSIIHRVRGYEKRVTAKLKRDRKKCKPDKIKRVVAKAVYRAWPGLEPGITGLVPAPGPAMAAAWCQCRAGRYEDALEVLKEPALFGWDSAALSAYAYLLGMMKNPDLGLRILEQECRSSNKRCSKIKELLKHKKSAKDTK